jgi:hypothetical protein
MYWLTAKMSRKKIPILNDKNWNLHATLILMVEFLPASGEGDDRVIYSSPDHSCM